MTLPNQSSTELPLLLELERAGGSVRPGAEFYDKVAAHFPAIQPVDREMLRSNGRTKVWENRVDWVRNELRTLGQLNGGQRSLWQITQDGKRRLRQDLVKLGLPATDVDNFIRGTDTLPQRLGQRWQPKPWAPRLRGARPPKPTPLPPQPLPTEQQQTAVTIAPTPPVPTDIRTQLLERVRALDDTRFERFCGRLLEVLGLEDVRITGRSHDRGIDGTATLKHLGLGVAFQAKNWRNNQVGSRQVREFRGSIVNRFPVGMYITTSSFTATAQEEGDEPGSPKLVLIDGKKLVDIMLEKGLGKRTVPKVTEEVDEEFFASI